MTEKEWIVVLEEDPETGDIILPIPTELLEIQGWKEGDVLDVDVNDDGEIILVKSDNHDSTKEG